MKPRHHLEPSTCSLHPQPHPVPLCCWLLCSIVPRQPCHGAQSLHTVHLLHIHQPHSGFLSCVLLPEFHNTSLQSSGTYSNTSLILTKNPTLRLVQPTHSLFTSARLFQIGPLSHFYQWPFKPLPCLPITYHTTKPSVSATDSLCGMNIFNFLLLNLQSYLCIQLYFLFSPSEEKLVIFLIKSHPTIHVLNFVLLFWDLTHCLLLTESLIVLFSWLPFFTLGNRLKYLLS